MIPILCNKPPYILHWKQYRNCLQPFVLMKLGHFFVILNQNIWGEITLSTSSSLRLYFSSYWKQGKCMEFQGWIQTLNTSPVSVVFIPAQSILLIHSYAIPFRTFRNALTQGCSGFSSGSFVINKNSYLNSYDNSYVYMHLLCISLRSQVLSISMTFWMILVQINRFSSWEFINKFRRGK